MHFITFRLKAKKNGWTGIAVFSAVTMNDNAMCHSVLNTTTKNSLLDGNILSLLVTKPGLIS
jgi:hypothetical protein